MPLSKERMRERKRHDRAGKQALPANIRFDNQLPPVSQSNHVKPKLPIIDSKAQDIDYIDADGYPVYDD
mgnify:CR=1 FL=1